MHSHRHGLDVAIEPGKPSRRPHVVKGAWPPAGNVVENGPGGDAAVLKNDAYLTPQRYQVEGPDRLAVVKSVAAFGSLETEQKAQQRGFAAARLSDKGDELPGFDAQRHIVEHQPGTLSVAKADMAELDVSRERARLSLIRTQLGFGCQYRAQPVEQRYHPKHCRRSAHQCGIGRKKLTKCRVDREKSAEA